MIEVTPDMAALATAVLKGDALAAGALADYVVENASGNRERVNREYVEELEDLLRDYKRLLESVHRSDRQEVLGYRFFRLQQMAKYLNRQGLS